MFRKPKLIAIDYIDVVIEDKPLLLIHWNFKYAINVRIKGITKSSRSPVITGVIHLPQLSNSIEIIASNYWKNIKYSIVLKHVVLDPSTANLLIHDFKPLSNLHSTIHSPTLINIIASIIDNTLNFKAINLAVKNKIIFHQNIKYQPNGHNE